MTVELVTVPNVELLEVGTWDTSTGTYTWTVDDLQAAVAAQDDPAYRTPVLKIGHVDPRFDGQPAVGAVTNLRLSADKQTLIGDLSGVPKWLAEILPSAYPNRSIEGEFGMVTATGTRHQFALSALALLGTVEPAVSTLADIAALFEAKPTLVSATNPTKNPLRFPSMPPRVAAAISIDELRDAFYEAQPSGSWAWIRECYVGEDAFIIVDDDYGSLFRIPWSEVDGKVAWGTPEKVVVEYVPAPAEPADEQVGLVLLSRTPIPARRPTEVHAMSPEQLAAIGLSEDATPEQIETQLVALGEWVIAERDALAAAATTKPPVVDLPEGTTVIDEAQLQELVAAAKRGADAHETLRKQNRDVFLTGCVKAGKFPPARLQYWSDYYDRDETGAREFLSKVAAGAAVPISPVGNDLAPDLNDDDALYGALFPTASQSA